MAQEPNDASSIWALIRTLNEPQERKALWSLLENHFVAKMFSNPTRADFDGLPPSPLSPSEQGLNQLAMIMQMTSTAMGRFFDERVRPRLGSFAPIASDDFASAACQHLAGCTTLTAFEGCYPRFLAHLKSLTGIGLRTGQSTPILDGDVWNRIAWPSEPIYSSHTGLIVHLDRVVETAYSGGMQRTLVTTSIEMEATFSAIKEASPQITAAVECICSLLFENSIVLGTDLEEQINDICDDAEPLPQDIAQLESNAFSLAYARVALCIKLFLDHNPRTKNRGKDDPYNPLRIYNAVHLATQALAQADPAVGLSLWISTIEALLGSGNEAISDKLARRIACLLVSTPDDRRAAVKSFGTLYNLRSRVLHGESVTPSMQGYHQARTLVAAVLSAILDWLLWAQRAKIGPSREEGLFSQLEDAMLAGKRLVGVPDHLAFAALEDDD